MRGIIYRVTRCHDFLAGMIFMSIFLVPFLMVRALPPVWAQQEGDAPVIRSITPALGYTNTATPISILGENLTIDTKISIYEEDPLPGKSCRVTGWAQGVHAQGDYVYVADDTLGLQIIDISQPDQPAIRGSYDTPGWASGVQVQSNFAYIADGYSGLQVIDISRPDAPALTGSYDTPGYAYGVFVRGTCAYVADDRCGLQIIDISQPARPALRGSCDTPGSAHGVFVTSDYAYVADGDSGLQIINISQPARPVLAGAFDTPGNALGVFVSGACAYIADGGCGLQIVDISQPAKPVLRGSYGYRSGSGWACGVFVRENMAFVADGNSGLQVIDANNPARPTLKALCRTPGSPYGVVVLANFAYLADGGSGLRMVNITHLDSPVLPRNYDTPGWAYEAFVHKGYAYVADGDSGLQVIGFDNNGQPTQAASLETSGRTQGVRALGNYLYLADGDCGLAIIDISQPVKPVLKGACDTPGQAAQVFITADHAYVADGDSGLAVIDITHPDQPQVVGSCDTSGIAQGVFVAGSHAYVADGDSGLAVIDITHPGQPKLTGVYNTPGSAHGVFIAGSYAYIADGDSGLQIADIKNPEQPVFAGEYNTEGSAQGVFVLEGYAYVADKASGLAVVDVKNPGQPLPIAHLGPNLTGQAAGLCLDQERIYLASGASGLQTLSRPIFWLTRIERISSGGGQAQVTIPAGLPQGFYTVRATRSSSLSTWLSSAFEMTTDNPLIRILYPQGGEIFKQTVRIQWLADQGSASPEAVSIDLDYSPDRGKTWKPIATGEKNDGQYDWDTSRMADGDDYLVRVTCRADDQGVRKTISQAVSEASFSIANSNTRPQVLDVSAQQQPDGLVAIHCRCLDTEQTSLTISFQYWDGSEWRPCSSVSTAGRQQAGLPLSATWKAREDVAGRFYPQCRIKVTADDGQAVDHLAEGESQPFALDTAPPKSSATPAGGVYASRTAVTLTASDDSAVAAIYYTTDGSNPTISSPRFSGGPIAIENTLSLKFFAVDSFGNQEPIRVENYRMSKKVVIQAPGPAWPGSSINVTCQVQKPDGSMADQEAVRFTLLVDGAAVFGPDTAVGKVLLLNSARNQALVETAAGKVIISLTNSRAEEVHLVVRDTERMGLEIASPGSGLAGLAIKFLDPDLDEDGDGLTNRTEASGCLKINSSDSDGDGLPDGYEYSHSCLDPCDAGAGSGSKSSHGPYGDPDGDGIRNLAEFRWGTDPCLKDTDGDGLDDGLEWGKNAQQPLDSDTDGLIDALDPDSDNDGLSDGREYFTLKTSHTSPDTDQDGWVDSFEVGPDPNHPTLCRNAQGELSPCALDAGNDQVRPVIKSIRPGWSADGISTLTVDGENLTASTLLGIFRDDPPVRVGACAIPQGEALGVCTRGNYAYVAAGSSGLVIIDLSQPDQPVVKANCPLVESAYGICMAGNYACVAAGYSGLSIIDLGQPDRPVLKGSCNTPGYARGVWVLGNLAYVADEWAGLQVIDISQPDKPALISSLATPDWAYGICGQGNYVYIAAGYTGLVAIDVTRPQSPALAAGCDTPGYAEGVSVLGGCAYVADGYSSLQVIDLTRPRYPFLMTGVELPDRIHVLGLSLSEEYLVGAAGSAGLTILSRPHFWSARTTEVNAAGTQITAVVPARIPAGSYTVKASNPPYGVADPIDMTFEATTNTPPQVQILSVSRQEKGAIAITYRCLDQEQSLVNIQFQYWDGSRWRDSRAITETGPQPTGADLTAIWLPGEELEGQELAACRIKVKADDGQSANGFAEAQSAPFPLDTRPPEITVSPVGGSFASPQTIALSTDEAATIYYTTDGTDPNTGSNCYTGPLLFSGTTTLKVFALDSYGNQGDIRKETYTISTASPPQNQQPGTQTQPAADTGGGIGGTGGGFSQTGWGYSPWIASLSGGNWPQFSSPLPAFTFGTSSTFGTIYGAFSPLNSFSSSPWLFGSGYQYYESSALAPASYSYSGWSGSTWQESGWTGGGFPWTSIYTYSTVSGFSW
ncbi:MAG: chitobiase/beta-hexosaminidase C-terminal domain-containing protein [bacterium]